METKKRFKLIKAKHGWLRVALMTVVVVSGLALGSGNLAVHADSQSNAPQTEGITNQNTTVPDVQTAQQQVTDAQNQANQAQQTANTANENLEKQTKNVTDAQTAVANDQQKVQTAQTKLPEVQAAANAQQKVADDTQAVADIAQQQQNAAQATATTAHENLANAQAAQQQAQAAVDNSHTEKITLPDKDLYVPYDKSKIEQWNSQGLNNNKFVDNEADKYHVDYTHLTDAQNAEIQNYYGDLLNQVRTQWNTNQVTVGGQGIEGLASDIMKRYEQDHWSIDKTNDHDVAAISQAAADYGLLTGGNYYENLSWNYLRVYDNANDMNGLKSAIYHTMIDMLFDDAGLHYGHTQALLGNYRDKGSTQAAVAFDDMNQIHLIGMNDNYVVDASKWSSAGAHQPLTTFQLLQDVLEKANQTVQTTQQAADVADQDLATKTAVNQQAQVTAQAAQNKLNDLLSQVREYQNAPQKLAADQQQLQAAENELAQAQAAKSDADAALQQAQANLAHTQAIAAVANEIATSQTTAQQQGYHVVGNQVVNNQGQQVQGWTVSQGHMQDAAGNLIKVQAGWNGSDHNTYFDENGQPLTGLQTIDNNLYDFDENGLAKTDVVKVGDTYYYFDRQTHAAVKNDYVQARWGDWYMFGNDGKIVTGVYQWQGTYYYFDPVTYLRVDNNYVQSQWGDWYMFGNDGKIVTGVYQWQGTYYYFDPVTYLRVDNNYVQSQWGDCHPFILIGGATDNNYVQSQWGDWYMFGNDGKIVTGVYQWQGTYYYFDPLTYLRVDNAYVQSQWGDWYMFGNDGKIITGLVDWYGAKYYFDPVTYLKVTNAWVNLGFGWGYFDQNGQMTRFSTY